MRTGAEKCFCKTPLFTSDSCGVEISGWLKVSWTIFHTTASSNERKQLFPCIPGNIWSLLICFFTASLRVMPSIHLLVAVSILLLSFLQFTECLVTSRKFPLLCPMQTALNYRMQLLIVRQSINLYQSFKDCFFFGTTKSSWILTLITSYLDFLNNGNVICGKK